MLLHWNATWGIHKSHGFQRGLFHTDLLRTYHISVLHPHDVDSGCQIFEREPLRGLGGMACQTAVGGIDPQPVDMLQQQAAALKFRTAHTGTGVANDIRNGIGEDFKTFGLVGHTGIRRTKIRIQLTELIQELLS